MTQAKSPSRTAAPRRPQIQTDPEKSTFRGQPGKVLKRSRYTKAETFAIFQRFHADNPEPKGELDYVNAFTLLVAVVLSAQATDVGVNGQQDTCSRLPTHRKRWWRSGRTGCGKK